MSVGHAARALRLIRRGLHLGFTAERILILLQLWRGGSNSCVRTIALGHAEDLQRRIAGMQAMVRALEPFTAHRHGGDHPGRPLPNEGAEGRAGLLRASATAANRPQNIFRRSP